MPHAIASGLSFGFSTIQNERMKCVEMVCQAEPEAEAES